MKRLEEYYIRFQEEIRDLWHENVTAALGEEVNSGTIIRYLLRDKARVGEIVERVGPSGRGKKILDIGCAYGFYDIILKEEFGCDMVGLEMRESVDAYCRLLRKHNVPVVEGALSKERIHIADESFDFVIFSEVLEHLRISPLRALREVHRVLKPGGMMLLTTPNIGYLRNIAHLMTGKNILQPFPENDEGLDNVTDALIHTRAYVMTEVVHLIQKAGMDVATAGYISSEKLDLRLRLNLALHLLFIILITVIPSFRSSILIMAGKHSRDH